MMSEDEFASHGMVPTWAVQLVADISSIKAQVASLPEIKKELDQLQAKQIPISEHQALMTKAESLWSDYQVRIAHQAADRSRTLFVRWMVAVLIGALSGLDGFLALHR